MHIYHAEIAIQIQLSGASIPIQARRTLRLLKNGAGDQLVYFYDLVFCAVYIFRKAVKIAATRCQILRLKYTKSFLRLKPSWGSLQRSLDP